MDWLWFQDNYRLNGRPYLSLLDLKEKCTRYTGVQIIEADLFDCHDHESSRAKQGSILPHIFVVLDIVCGADTKARI